MNNNYYASEYTLNRVYSELDTLNDNFNDFTTSFNSISLTFYTLFFVIALILSAKFLEELLDSFFNSRKR